MSEVIAKLAAILSDVGITPAEFAVMWHVRDTVIQPRDVLAAWTAENLPNDVPADITLDDCAHAVDSLVRKGLLIELSDADIDADLARWRSEPLPVSWGVDRSRRPGDVDLTEAGFRLEESITRRECPDVVPRAMSGCNYETPGVIRVFGETEESCQRELESIVKRIDDFPWRWPRDSFELEPMRPLGPWWYSRFERAPTGFEIVVRRVDRGP